MTSATDRLILDLAGNAPRVSPRHVPICIVASLVIGAFASFALLLSWLGIRSDLVNALLTVPFATKLAFNLATLAAALGCVMAVARPESMKLGLSLGIAAPAAFLAILAVAELAEAPKSEWYHLWLGQSAAQCPWFIVLLSLPISISLFWALRHQAPTRLRLAGAIGGACSGAAAGAIYGFYCTETSALFVVSWYSLGIAISTLIGALLGPRLLRW